MKSIDGNRKDPLNSNRSSSELFKRHFQVNKSVLVCVRRDTACWLLVVGAVDGSGAHGRYFLLCQRLFDRPTILGEEWRPLPSKLGALRDSLDLKDSQWK